MGYWLVKAILTPILRILFRPGSRASKTFRRPARRSSPATTCRSRTRCSCRSSCPRKITFLAKSDYFTGRGLKGWLTRQFFSGAGQVPVDRSGGRASAAAITTAMRVLGEGKLLGIYPEGTRSPDGRLYRGKTGVARMALESGVPVIPVAMIGTYEIQPPGKMIPKIKRAGVRIGKPLDFSRYAGMSTDRFVLRSVTDEIVYELMQLSGQEYVDTYATKAKEDIAESELAAQESLVADEPPARRRAS